MLESPPGAEVVINGRRLIYFGGTGYFGLQGHPEVIQAGIEAFRQYGLHVATSRIGFGVNPIFLALEKKIAEFFGTEEAVYLASGYLTNLVLVQGLNELYEKIFIDELAHFSLKDAVYSVKKPVITFHHRDPEDLRTKIKAELKARERPLIISDGLFPTFGSLAPVEAYLALIEEYDGLLCLDDAHGVGILGPHGRGTFDYFGLKGDRLFFGATLSKAFGGYGGFVPGKREFLEKVRLTSGVYKGATPAPTPVAAASLKALELVASHPEWRAGLYDNVHYLKSGLKQLGLEIDETPVPIVAWTMKTADEMQQIQQELFRRGIAIAYLQYVGAPAGGVLRISVFSTHTKEHLDRLLSELKSLL